MLHPDKKFGDPCDIKFIKNMSVIDKYGPDGLLPTIKTKNLGDLQC